MLCHCVTVMLGCPQPCGYIPQLRIKHSAVPQAFSSGPPASEESPKSVLCQSTCSCSFSQAWSSRVIETNSSLKEWVVLMVTVSGRAAAPGISFCQHWAGVSVLHFKTLFQGLEPDTGYQMWFLLCYQMYDFYCVFGSAHMAFYSDFNSFVVSIMLIK